MNMTVYIQNKYVDVPQKPKVELLMWLVELPPPLHSWFYVRGFWY